MTDYYGKPVSTHKFFPVSLSKGWKPIDNDVCAVWKCGLPEEDPVHRHDA